MSKAAALRQRDVQLQQLEELKHRILADRCAASNHSVYFEVLVCFSINPIEGFIP